MNNICRIVVLVANLSLICNAFGVNRSKISGKPSLQLQNLDRVAEIASYLPERPTIFGAGIKDRKSWGKFAYTSAGVAALKLAQKRMRNPIPEWLDRLYLEFSTPGNGDRRNFEKLYFQRINSLIELAVGECIENKGRFIPIIVKYIDAICEERTWTMPAHDRKLLAFKGEQINVDLGAVHRAAICAWILSAFGDALPENSRIKLRSSLEHRIFAPIRKISVAKKRSDVLPMWWFQNRNNWTAVCHASVTFAALSVLEDKMDRATFVENAERSVPCFLSGFTDDGYCSEGLGYWNYGWGEFLMMSLAVRQATAGKVDFCASPKAEKIMKFGTGVLVSGRTAASIADGGGQSDSGVLQLGHLIWPELPITKEATTRVPFKFGFIRSLFLDFGQWDESHSKKVAEYPIRTTFPDAQMFVMRPSTTDTMPLRLSVKAGHNDEFHNHNDVGTYALFFNDILLSGDCGGTIYTAKTFSTNRYEIKMLNSYGHPVPVLNGGLQMAGRIFKGNVLSTSFESERDIVTFDMAGAYDSKVSKVQKLERTFIYDRTNQTVSVTDSVAFAERGRFSVPVITPGVMVSDNVGGYVLSVHDAKRKRLCHLNVSIEVNGSPWKIMEEHIDNPGMISPNRYAITLTEPVASASVTITYRMFHD